MDRHWIQLLCTCSIMTSFLTQSEDNVSLNLYLDPPNPPLLTFPLFTLVWNVLCEGRILRRKWLLIGLFAWDTYRCGAIFSNFNLAPVGELWGEHSPGEHL